MPLRKAAIVASIRASSLALFFHPWAGELHFR